MHEGTRALEKMRTDKLTNMNGTRFFPLQTAVCDHVPYSRAPYTAPISPRSHFAWARLTLNFQRAGYGTRFDAAAVGLWAGAASHVASYRNTAENRVTSWHSR